MRPDFESIAIFILATTRTEPNRPTSSLSSRILPLIQTWGGHFSSTYFVFGTNEVDYQYVQSPSCVLSDDKRGSSNSSRRRLRASSLQVPSRNAADLYSCHQDGVDLKILFVGNCTGEYFGYGPVCRCQESMRYYLDSPQLTQHEWFAFMDDDLYFRPYSLVAMLAGVKQARSRRREGDIYALISSQAYRSFQFSSRWRVRAKAEAAGGYNCKVPSAHNFPVAMPAFMNRATMQALRSALDSNGLTRLQETWGGSGDALLGMLLWMYEIPVLSFARAYVEAAMAANQWNLRPFNRSQIFVVHKVKNIQNLTTKRGHKISVPGQQDVCRYFGDRPFQATLTLTGDRPFQATPASSSAAATPTTQPNTKEAQVRAGREAAAAVFAMRLGNVKETVYRRVDVRKKWVDFTFADCALAEIVN